MNSEICKCKIPMNPYWDEAVRGKLCQRCHGRIVHVVSIGLQNWTTVELPGLLEENEKLRIVAEYWKEEFLLDGGVDHEPSEEHLNNAKKRLAIQHSTGLGDVIRHESEEKDPHVGPRVVIDLSVFSKQSVSKKAENEK